MLEVGLAQACRNIERGDSEERSARACEGNGRGHPERPSRGEVRDPGGAKRPQEGLGAAGKCTRILTVPRVGRVPYSRTGSSGSSKTLSRLIQGAPGTAQRNHLHCRTVSSSRKSLIIDADCTIPVKYINHQQGLIVGRSNQLFATRWKCH